LIQYKHREAQEAQRWEKEEVIHERMWEAHFCAVDGAIARAFNDGQEVMVLGVEDNALDSSL